MVLDYLIPKALAAAATSDSAPLIGGETGVKNLSKITSFIISNIGSWTAGIVIVIASFFLAKIASTAARNAIIRSKGEEVQENALVLVDRLTKMGIITVGITIALAINGLNFTAVIGAISLGIGFALKQFIENFIASVVMLAQNRIHIGDLVDINGTLGRIVSVDMRTTVIQQLDGSMVTIANQAMLGSVWVSYSTNPFRRIELLVWVGFDADLKAATSIIRGVITKYPEIAIKPKPLVLVDGFSEYGVTLRVLFWVETTKPFLVIRSNLAYRIMQAFDAAGINMPYPIRVLKIDQNDPVILKTIDSIKKGVVPESEQSTMTKEKIKELALETEKLDKVPFNVFEPPKPAPVPVAESPAPLPQKPNVNPK